MKKAFLLYDHESIGVYWNQPTILRLYGNRTFWILKVVSDLFWGMALLLGLWGALLVFRRQGIIPAALSIPILLWLYFTGVYSTTLYRIGIISPRYRSSQCWLVWRFNLSWTYSQLADCEFMWGDV